MRLSRFLLFASSIALLVEVKMKGRKMDEWEERKKKNNLKFTASKKRPLNKKQQIARDKSKRASKSRNKLRSHYNYKTQLKNERISRSIK